MGNIIAVVIFIGMALASATFFILYPGQVFTWYLLFKPIVDGFLEQGATIGGATLSCSHVPSLIIPSFFAMLAMFHANRLKYLPFKGLIILYIFLNIVAFFKEGRFSIDAAGFYIRVIFPMFLFFGVPLFVESRHSLERVVKIAAISGIFPCAMIFLQKFGFIRYNREAEMLGSVVYDRATGGYADSFSVALPIIISIFFMLNVIQYNKDNNRPQLLYEIMLGGYLFSLIFTFHRMTYIVVTLAVVVWIYLNRRMGYAIILFVVAVVSFSTLKVFVPDFFGDIDIVANNTPGVVVLENGDNIGLSSAALHGRGWLWRKFLVEYFNASFIDQLVGSYLPGRAPHNDYIRVLFTVGAFGTAIYLFMLAAIGYRLLSIVRYYSRSGDHLLKNLSQTSLFMFMFYMLGGVTLTISLLSTMSWYFWLLVGIITYQHNKERYAERQKMQRVFVMT